MPRWTMNQTNQINHIKMQRAKNNYNKKQVKPGHLLKILPWHNNITTINKLCNTKAPTKVQLRQDEVLEESSHQDQSIHHGTHNHISLIVRITHAITLSSNNSLIKTVGIINTPINSSINTVHQATVKVNLVSLIKKTNSFGKREFQSFLKVK